MPLSQASSSSAVPRHAVKPHHDGSARYVPQGKHEFGDVVPVSVSVPKSPGVRDVWLRVNHDGEARYQRATLSEQGEFEDTYTADVVVHNESTNYRFLLDVPRLPSGYLWLNGSGIHRRDVSEAHDFRLLTAPPAPSWLNDGLVYQIFPDRFARSSDAGPVAENAPSWAMPVDWDTEPATVRPGMGKQFFGGNLRGIIERLDHIAALGANTVYLTPVFPGQTNHRYDANTFDEIDPVLGGDAAYAELAAAVHSRGMRLVGDLTTNHTGFAHDWFQAARDPNSPEREMYLWADASGGGNTPPGGGIDVVNPPEIDTSYVAWTGHAELPKLNWASELVRQRMVLADDAALIRWLADPYRLDGWRVDVANMTGRYGGTDATAEVARLIRERLMQVNSQAAVIAEHFGDYTSDLTGDGWHASMNYAGFAVPVWNWLADPDANLKSVTMPVQQRRGTGRAMAATMRDFAARVPWQVASVQWNLLGSHDTPRLRTMLGTAANTELAAAMLFTYPGVPFVYAGDEVGLTGRTGEHGRATMAWNQAESGGPRWDKDVLAIYRDLSRIHRQSSALRAGGIRWLAETDDAVVYLRESTDERVLVVVARGPWSGVSLPKWVLGADEPELLYGGSQVATPGLRVTGDQVVIDGTGPAVGIWRLS